MKRLAQIEIGLAMLVAILAIACHAQATSHMGGLWRDEVNSVDIDSLPSFNDVWHNLSSDSYPVLWHVALKSWIDLGFNDDASFRCFGFLVGMAAIVALWINARIFKYTSPLVALVMLEFNPTIVYWGDSIRGHGLGLIFIIGMPGVIWLLLNRPAWPQVLLAAGICLLAVHSEYYSAVLLFSAGCAAITVGLMNRRYVGAGAVALVGLFCALSLLVYCSVLGGGGATNALHKAGPGEFTYLWFMTRVADAIGPVRGAVDYCIWILLFLAASILTFRGRFERDAAKSIDRYVGLYFLISWLVAFVGYFFFLKFLGWRTSSWYYIPLMGFCVVAVEGMLRSVPGRAFAIGRLVACAALTCFWFPMTWNAVPMRLTSVDLISKFLESNAAPGDFIIINPWNYYISFQRYYKGDTPWNTVPAMYARHFSDLAELRQIMMSPDQNAAMAPIFQQVAATLKRGNRLWIVGRIDFPPPGEKPFLLPPAPYGPLGWQENPYYYMWSEDLGYFVQYHGVRGTVVEIPTDVPISPFESPPFLCIQGWRDQQAPGLAGKGDSRPGTK